MKRKISLAFLSVFIIVGTFSAGVFAATGMERISAYLNHGLTLKVDGNTWTPASAPITYNGSTYLPLRALGEALGAGIAYDSATQTVSITSSGESVGGTGSTAASSVEYYFTRAGDKPEQALIDVINSAENTLDIAIYSLTHPDIVGAIRDAAKRGVKVRLIEDRLQASGASQTSALKILGSAGVELKQNKHSGLMHLKMTIADGKVATGGSFNYSKNATTNSDEVLTIFRDPKIAADFLARFNAMWNDDVRFETVERYIAMDPDEIEGVGEATVPTPAPSPTVPTPPAVPEPSPPASASCENPTIKGNRNSKIYHMPGQRDHDKTTANVEYFCTEQEAQDAGYRKAQR